MLTFLAEELVELRRKLALSRVPHFPRTRAEEDELRGIFLRSPWPDWEEIELETPWFNNYVNLMIYLGLYEMGVAACGELIRREEQVSRIGWANEPLYTLRLTLHLAVGDVVSARHELSKFARKARTNLPRDAGARIDNQVAWQASLIPTGINDREAFVRLAENAVDGLPANARHEALNTLGAALYRAGRFEEAIRRLHEGINLRNGAEEPLDWPFLAMAHHRLGHVDEARRWLDRLRNRDPNRDSLEIIVLRREAEAVVLYDPVFPADPFAH